MSITQTLTQKVTNAFVACGYGEGYGTVTVADRPDLGQFQCNGSFAAAKAHRKAPAAIAGDVVAELEKDSSFAAVSFVAPGFINMTLTPAYLVAQSAPLALQDGLRNSLPQMDETIVMDYGGPNVAKPLHIGHLRSAVIGQALKNIARAMGNKVISDTHLGDWGLQMGLVIAELEERYPSWPYFTGECNEVVDVGLTVDDLNEVYPTASAKSKADEAFKAKAKEATVRLQNGEPNYMALWKYIMKLSVADIKANYENLGVDFDIWYGESDAKAYVDGLVQTLQEQNLLQESEGALVVDVSLPDDKKPMPPVIIKKSDNSDIYATTDLATIIQREQDFKPDEIWYVVDARQGLHFEQVFRCAHKAHLVPDSTKLIFIGFGTVNGTDGKPFKTRDGGVMRLDDLVNTVTEAALEKLQSSSYVASLNDNEKKEVARHVGVAALKFGDLINYREKNYIFDIDRFLSFEGKTGPYILYMITRINSILKKMNIDYDTMLPLTNIYSDTETDILLKLLALPDIYGHAVREKAPNYICDHVYQLASLFSKFYHDTRIVEESNSEKQQAWLALILLVRKALLFELGTLGIEAVENM